MKNSRDNAEYIETTNPAINGVQLVGLLGMHVGGVDISIKKMLAGQERTQNIPGTLNVRLVPFSGNHTHFAASGT